MSLDLQRILESKAAHRSKLADLPIGEKLRLLDEMRERALTIQQARPMEEPVVREGPASYFARMLNCQDAESAAEEGTKMKYCNESDQPPTPRKGDKN